MNIPLLTRLIAGAVALATALLLAGCGWQLRGVDNRTTTENDRTLKDLSVSIHSAQKLSAINSLLEKSLKSLGVHVEASAPITIELASERIEKRPMAYGSTGIPIQYQITMTTQYAIHNKNAKTPSAQSVPISLNSENIHTDIESVNKKSAELKPQERQPAELKKVISRRTLDFDPELVSAKDHEEQELHAEMRKEIGRIILRDLRNTHTTPTNVSDNVTPKMTDTLQ